MLYIVLSFFFSVAVTLLVLPWILKLCYRHRLFDNIDGRKVHKQSIPRMGGVVFVPAAALAILLTYTIKLIAGSHDYDIIHMSSMIMGTGCFIIYFIGIIDDLTEVSARLKFVIQFIVACTFPICGLYLDNFYGVLGIHTLPLWFAYIFSVILTILIINAYNLIDGIDGLASCLSIFAFAVFAYHFYTIDCLNFCICIVALIGTLVVYTFYNIWGNVERCTKTFMGDSGSLILGTVLAYLTIKYAMANQPTLPSRADGLVVAFSAVLIPSLDLVRVALCRLLRHKGIFTPDKTHIHHKLMAKGLGMHPTLFLIVAIQVALYALNMCMFHLGASAGVIITVDILLYTALNVYLPIPNDADGARSTKALQPVNLTPYDVAQDKAKDEPLISIITATFNSAKTVRDTFESILHQTYTNYEIIVVDGLSKDNTMDIVREYEPRFAGRMKYKSEADRCLYEAMNKGIGMATGDVVGILNSDDFYSSADILKHVAEAFKSADVDAVYGDVHYVDADNLNNVTRYYSSRIFRPWLMRYGFMPAHPSFYCRREIVAAKGTFNTKYRVAADFDQVFRLLYMARIRARYLHFDFVTMREGGVSNSSLSSRMTIMTEHNDILRTNGLFSNTFLLSLRYIYKFMEVILSPYMPHPQLPPYIHQK